jgi:glycosyltransferase involved in cell wall biosynthesis
MCAELAALGFGNLGVLSRGVDLRHFAPGRRDARLRASWGVGDDDPVVMHVGRMAAEKNYPLLFRAYAAMRAANPRLRFVLAGEGPLKLKLQARHRECFFAGFFSREEIGRYYASADIYVHASLTETFGNVLTEAMASGLAVAGFDYAAARLFIRSGENGLAVPCVAVPCARPRRSSRAGVQLATDAALRNPPTLRRAAPASLQEQSWENVVARFETDLVAAAAATLPRPPA